MGTHCYGHVLNLAIGTFPFETAHEICKLVKKSPQRDTKLDEIQSSTKNESKAKEFNVLCPTRWTVRGDALASCIKNYYELRVMGMANIKDTEMKARVEELEPLCQHSICFSTALLENVS